MGLTLAAMHPAIPARARCGSPPAAVPHLDPPAHKVGEQGTWLCPSLA